MGAPRFHDRPHRNESVRLSKSNLEALSRLIARRGVTGAAVELGSSPTTIEKLADGGHATVRAVSRVALALALAELAP